MKLLFETVIVAVSMFSAVPMPKVDWNEKNMKYAICAFPAVGVLIGVLFVILSKVGILLQVPPFFMGILLAVLPILVTGGIHLDGYCDTQDALASHGDKDKLLEILSDPHIGAFAVIRLVTLMLVWSGLWVVWAGERYRTASSDISEFSLFLLFPIARILSGIGICRLPKAKKEGLAYLFASQTDRRRAVLILLFQAGICMFGMIGFGGWKGACSVAAACVIYGLYQARCKKLLGGTTGDLAGWFLVRCELYMLAAWYVCSLVMRCL